MDVAHTLRGMCVCVCGAGEPGTGSMPLYMLHAVQVVPRLTNIQVLYETTYGWMHIIERACM